MLCPRKKWRQEFRNVEVGDIVLIKAEKKYGKSEYRLGKVTGVKPDAHGTVRTATVATRNRRRAHGEDIQEVKAGTIENEVAIQRLAVILPVYRKSKEETLSENREAGTTDPGSKDGGQSSDVIEDPLSTSPKPRRENPPGNRHHKEGGHSVRRTCGALRDSFIKTRHF